MLKKVIHFIALKQIYFIVAVLVLTLSFPILFQDLFVLRMGTVCLMYIMLALGINLIMGYMGQMTFGHAAFWGIGAYTAAILSTRFGTDFLMDVVAAAAITGCFGFVLGLPVLKVKGYYLTIVTLGFGEIIRLIALNSTELTGGALGIKGISGIRLFSMEFSSPQAFYYVILIMVILTALMLVRINNSRYGLALKSIRDDDSAAEVMGVNVVHNKILTFVISAMIAGAAGAFFAHYISYIDSTSFTTQASQEMCVMVILGGLGSIPGTIIGAAVLTVVPEMIRGLAEYRMLIYGVIMVVMMLVRPQGMLGNVDFGRVRERLLEERQNKGRIEGRTSKDGKSGTEG